MLLALVFVLVSAGARADLEAGTALEFAEDSSASLEVVPGVSVAIAASGRLVVGADAAMVSEPVSFFGRPAHHELSRPAALVQSAGKGARLDLSGWTLRWGDEAIALGEGVALVTCQVDCGPGERFTLDYSSRVSEEAPFAGSPYRLHLEGTLVADVP